MLERDIKPQGSGRTGLGPDFFIVGAPKCGTTSLHFYLSAHPDVFMAYKEQHYFGSDLADSWSQPSAEEYFASFAGEGDVRLRGEASGLYLWSRSAAAEIHAYNPEARIIAAFRNPVDVLAALHSQFLHDGTEDIPGLREALAAEPDRRAGRRAPATNSHHVRRLQYREIVCFAEQLERYFVAFGRDHVHVVLFDDLSRNPAAVYRGILEFLGLDPSFAPSFEVHNQHKRLRSRYVRRFLEEPLFDPSSPLRRIGRRLLPVHSTRSAMLRHGAVALKRMNTSYRPRREMDSALRASLNKEFSAEVDRLSALLGRDLTHWYS